MLSEAATESSFENVSLRATTDEAHVENMTSDSLFVNDSNTMPVPGFSGTFLATTPSMTNAYVPAIPEAHVVLFSHVTRSFVNPILSIIGCTGNSLGVGVLWRQARQQKLSIFWYLCALTIADVVFLVLGVVDGIPRVVSATDKELSKYLIAHFRTYLAWIDNTFLHTARYIVVVMSCERLISVVKPLHVKNTWFAKYPVRIVLACLAFNVIIASPLVVNAQVVTIRKGNSTEYIFTFKNYDNFMAQWWVAEAIIHSFIPMFILVPINIAIPVQFYRSSNKLQSALKKDGSQQQGKVTATVLTITFMYIFLSIPLLVLKVFQYVNPDFNMNGKYRLYFWFIADLSKCLAYINAANDFVVYFIVSNNYRDMFQKMYCGFCRRKSDAGMNYLTNSKQAGSKETLSTSVSG